MRKILFFLFCISFFLSIKAEWVSSPYFTFMIDGTWSSGSGIYWTDMQILVSDITGDGNDNFLFINPVHNKVWLFGSGRYTSGTQAELLCTNSLANWQFDKNDKFISGRMGNNSIAYVLAISPTKKIARSYKYMETEKRWVEMQRSNNNWMGGWAINPGDRYILGDFLGTGREDMLCLAENGWAMLLKYTGQGWEVLWHNNGNGQLGGVYLKNSKLSDISFSVGNFQYTTRQQELFVIQNTWATLLRFDKNNNDWYWAWSQYGNKFFTTWELPLKKEHYVISGKFSNSIRDELVIIQERDGYIQANMNLIYWNTNSNTFKFIFDSRGNDKVIPGIEIAKYIGGKYVKYKNNGLEYLAQVNRYDGLKAKSARYNWPRKTLNANPISYLNNKTTDNLLIYPNPATDHINIGYELEENTELTIYSMDGKIIERLILNSELNEIRIETPHYKSGMYMYRYGNETGKFIIK